MPESSCGRPPLDPRVLWGLATRADVGADGCAPTDYHCRLTSPSTVCATSPPLPRPTCPAPLRRHHAPRQGCPRRAGALKRFHLLYLPARELEPPPWLTPSSVAQFSIVVLPDTVDRVPEFRFSAVFLLPAVRVICIHFLGECRNIGA